MNGDSFNQMAEQELAEAQARMRDLLAERQRLELAIVDCADRIQALETILHREARPVAPARPGRKPGSQSDKMPPRRIEFAQHSIRQAVLAINEGKQFVPTAEDFARAIWEIRDEADMTRVKPTLHADLHKLRAHGLLPERGERNVFSDTALDLPPATTTPAPRRTRRPAATTIGTTPAPSSPRRPAREEAASAVSETPAGRSGGGDSSAA